MALGSRRHHHLAANRVPPLLEVDKGQLPHPVEGRENLLEEGRGLFQLAEGRDYLPVGDREPPLPVLVGRVPHLVQGDIPRTDLVAEDMVFVLGKVEAGRWDFRGKAAAPQRRAGIQGNSL